MIELYFAPTPNGLKIKLFLEETGLSYRIHAVNLAKGDQFKPEFLTISPNNKIPAIVDTEPAFGSAPLAVFESGAVLVYLAEKAGRYLSPEPLVRLTTLQWLFWQVGGLGPMAGQMGHFAVYAPEPIPYALDRYRQEVRRLYGVLDKQLAANEYIAGEYSIADMACYPWIVPHEAHEQNLRDFTNLKRWYDAIASRPATIRAYESVAPTYGRERKKLSDEERKMMFGSGHATNKP